MNIRIHKGVARGAIDIPKSKSIAHRLLILAGLAEGKSYISKVPVCDDVDATLKSLSALGAKVKRVGEDVEICGISTKKRDTGVCLWANESGSTLRFLIPIVLLLGGGGEIVCKSALLKRPLTVFDEIFPSCITKKEGSVFVNGALTGGEYRVRGDVSSQFISGLLFALPLCENDSRIVITTPLESRSYINLTIDALSKFGARAIWENENTIFIPKNQVYKPITCEVEGDYSAGAFIEAFNYLGGEVLAGGLSDTSLQGDRVYRDYFEKLKDKNAELDISDCPDNAPMLFALSAYLNGGVFLGTRRLKIKESDRALAMQSELSKLGADITINENSVIIKKVDLHPPISPIDTHNDHRIAMAMGVLLTKFGGDMYNCEVVKKSYPQFWLDITKLGIVIEEI